MFRVPDRPISVAARRETFRRFAAAAGTTTGPTPGALISLLTASLPEETGIGAADLSLLQAEVEAYAGVGLFDGEAPDITPYLDDARTKAIYDDGRVIWPD